MADIYISKITAFVLTRTDGVGLQFTVFNTLPKGNL